ncbi:hypothetical protein BAC3_01855 [uncultured bacterium]|nr:hypothetical protein BAC3_01855 [uncultured bacterium]
MKYTRLVLSFFIFTFALTMGKFAGADEVKCPLCGAKLAGNENTDYQITFTECFHRRGLHYNLTWGHIPLAL